MKLAVVIPNLNGAHMLAKCLESLKKQTVKAEIIVADNGSTDDSVYIIEEQFPEVTLIKSHKNLGFAGGVNLGLRYALENGFEAVALFNNDAVADKYWLEELVNSLKENPRIGVVTCKFMRDDKKHFDSTGDNYSTRGIPFPRGRNRLDKGQFDVPEYVFGASGGASLYRAKMLEEIGLFDERFFAYYEDVDISFRARLASWEVFYTPNSVAYHMVSGTSSAMGTNFSHFHSNKNFYYLYLKNMPGRLFWKYLPLFAYQGARSLASSLVNRRILSYLKAMFLVIWNLPGVFIDRVRIQSRRKAGINEIEDYLHKGRPPIAPPVS